MASHGKTWHGKTWRRRWWLEVWARRLSRWRLTISHVQDSPPRGVSRVSKRRPIRSGRPHLPPGRRRQKSQRRHATPYYSRVTCYYLLLGVRLPEAIGPWISGAELRTADADADADRGQTDGR